jgi:hypothetical protein
VSGDILLESINIAFDAGAGDYESASRQDELVDDQETGWVVDTKYQSNSYNLIDE